ncbi:UNVERIFIED_CONTAM: Heterogeneous nuclear ribonucleoprotein Q [Sesamum radiatum]|uniref:Heterogeneous nuclear ribonucleoprotein Q n=1 Tax=Sesamum radiatum TaxID=300843 RepID=A0AAW2R562_SESRA
MVWLNDEVTESSNLVRNVIEKSNHVDLVTERTCLVNEVMGQSDITNANLVDRVTKKTITANNVTEKSNVDDRVMETSKVDQVASLSEPIACMKGNDVRDIDSVDAQASRLKSGARVTEPMIDEKGDLRCIMEMETSKVNIVTGVPQQMVSEKEDVGPVASQNVGPVGNRSIVCVGEKNGSTIGNHRSRNMEVANDAVATNKGLLLSGELEALERKKRRRTEIFVSGLGEDTNENDIRKVFEEAGTVTEVRLVVNSKTGKNKGFAFVRFATAADATKALAKYSIVKIRGKQCGAAPVQGNDTIYIGNIDREWKTEDVSISVYIDLSRTSSSSDVTEELSFCRLLKKKNLFGKNLKIKVAWAQPLVEPAEEEILKVKSVYAEYLPSSWDEENVKEYFRRFGEIESVVLAKDLPSSRRKDFAFINYTSRDAALLCIEAIGRERLEDDTHGSKVKMTASLAKPVSKSKQMENVSDLTSKRLPKKNLKALQSTTKPYEPRNKGKLASSSYGQAKVDNSSCMTNELVEILRQQAASSHILPPRNIVPRPMVSVWHLVATIMNKRLASHQVCEFVM